MTDIREIKNRIRILGNTVTTIQQDNVPTEAEAATIIAVLSLLEIAMIDLHRIADAAEALATSHPKVQVSPYMGPQFDFGKR